jgi:F0F1-type ATP synthase gamma subunit
MQSGNLRARVGYFVKLLYKLLRTKILIINSTIVCLMNTLLSGRKMKLSNLWYTVILIIRKHLLGYHFIDNFFLTTTPISEAVQLNPISKSSGSLFRRGFLEQQISSIYIIYNNLTNKMMEVEVCEKIITINSNLFSLSSTETF